MNTTSITTKSTVKRMTRALFIGLLQHGCSVNVLDTIDLFELNVKIHLKIPVLCGISSSKLSQTNIVEM